MKQENGDEIKIDVHVANIDHSFLDVFGIKILESRNFSQKFQSDDKGVLVNEAFVKKVGWEKPLNNLFKSSPVIGVINNFHFNTLHKPVEPVVLSLEKEFFRITKIGVRIKAENQESILGDIKSIFTQTLSGQPFDFYFLDDAYNRLYRNEQRIALMIGYLENT